MTEKEKEKEKNIYEHTKDTIIYEKAMSNKSSEFPEKPFLQHELMYVTDQNGSSDYNRNEVVFDTVNISNNGKFCDYSEAFISIPIVTTIERTNDHLTAEQGLMKQPF